VGWAEDLILSGEWIGSLRSSSLRTACMHCCSLALPLPLGFHSPLLTPPAAAAAAAAAAAVFVLAQMCGRSMCGVAWPRGWLATRPCAPQTPPCTAPSTACPCRRSPMAAWAAVP